MLTILPGDSIAKGIFKQVTAFCPGHISGFFNPYLHEEPEFSGSSGGGLVIDAGVTVVASPSDDIHISVQVQRNGIFREEMDRSPVLEDLLHRLDVRVRVETRTALPLSSGYGLSAASLLALVHAVNQLFDLRFSDYTCALYAHREEVLHRTGLGDVAACQGGGWVYREKPGIIPGIRRGDDPRSIYAVTIDPLKTSSILSSPDTMRKITHAFPSVVPRSLEELMTLSRQFAEESGLIQQSVREVLSICDEQHILASMTMLGNGVFALGEESPAALGQFGEVYHLHLARHGPQIIEVIR